MRSPSDFGKTATCRDADPEIFFPSSGHSDAPAKQICSLCSVVEECLRWALAHPNKAPGVWGGTSENQRKRILRQRRRRSGAPSGGAASS